MVGGFAHQSGLPRRSVKDENITLKIPQVPALVQRLLRLPAMAVCEWGKPNPHLGHRCQDPLPQRVAQAGFDLDLPNKGGKHRNDIRRFYPSAAVLHHGSTRTQCRWHCRRGTASMGKA